MTGRRRVSVWAVPAGADESLFVEQIALLAVAGDSRPFPPHITVVSAVAGPDTVGVIAEVVAATERFEVELVDVQDSEDRFRCVTLTASAADPLVGLRNSLAVALGEPAGSYAPHLSLLYAELDAATRTRMKHFVDVSLPRAVAVDRVQLVDTSDGDFTRWSVEQTWHLRVGRTPG